MRKFSGEDLTKNERTRQQFAEQQTWAAEQIEEKKMKQQMDEDLEREFSERIQEINHRIEDLDEERLRAKVSLMQSDRDYNVALVRIISSIHLRRKKNGNGKSKKSWTRRSTVWRRFKRKSAGSSSLKLSIGIPLANPSRE